MRWDWVGFLPCAFVAVLNYRPKKILKFRGWQILFFFVTFRRYPTLSAFLKYSYWSSSQLGAFCTARSLPRCRHPLNSSAYLKKLSIPRTFRLAFYAQFCAPFTVLSSSHSWHLSNSSTYTDLLSVPQTPRPELLAQLEAICVVGVTGIVRHTWVALHLPNM